MAKFELDGILYKIFETKEITDNFIKREFVLQDNTNPKYPQFIKFELYNENTYLLNNLTENQEVIVSFDIRGREYSKNGEISYFNSLVAYSISLKNNETENKTEEEPVFATNDEKKLPKFKSSEVTKDDNSFDDEEIPF
jgi:hypothetical protein